MKKIIICDDDDGIVDAVSIILQDMNYNVTVCRSGEKFFQKVEEVKPDLILLDLWVPGKSGKDITHELKANTTMKHIPIIIMSANRNIKDIAKQIKADDYLPKPFDISDLESKVKKYTTKKFQ